MQNWLVLLSISMAYINIAEWTPDQVTDWIRGKSMAHLAGQGKVQQQQQQQQHSFHIKIVIETISLIYLSFLLVT